MDITWISSVDSQKGIANFTGNLSLKAMSRSSSFNRGISSRMKQRDVAWARWEHIFDWAWWTMKFSRVSAILQQDIGPESAEAHKSRCNYQDEARDIGRYSGEPGPGQNRQDRVSAGKRVLKGGPEGYVRNAIPARDVDGTPSSCATLHRRGYQASGFKLYSKLYSKLYYFWWPRRTWRLQNCADDVQNHRRIQNPVPSSESSGCLFPQRTIPSPDSCTAVSAQAAFSAQTATLPIVANIAQDPSQTSGWLPRSSTSLLIPGIPSHTSQDSS
ncbi:hypothetical protein DFH08DRAFT_1037927 [Mycena albidolilacea]|uniref:Uncharacterized protein n=1 Tax=Mycena albidolilacea TaxID=1033008 RepID=A0AAD7AHZ4_9AGAR|nr:hypothetical protein DFH08DRAFT_1037927 [Mycena albidolilacea]